MSDSPGEFVPNFPGVTPGGAAALGRRLDWPATTFKGAAKERMQVRSFQPSDLPVLSQIDQSCFPPGIAYTRKELAEYIRNRFSMTWVAEANSVIVGFVVLNRQPSSVAHIITIDVIESWRRRGAGAALMEAAEGWARQTKLDLLRLETAENNVQAQKFYEKRGYKRVEKIERYYSRNLAAWVMEKQLNSTRK